MNVPTKDSEGIDVSCKPIGVPGKKVCIASFPDHVTMGLTMVRLQEFYESESIEFRGKYFTLPKYAAWWAERHGNGVFDYPERWGGYNVPGETIKDWERSFRGNEGTLRSVEEALLSSLKRESGTSSFDDVYLIGVTKDDVANRTDTLVHEMSHAIYRMDTSYQRSALEKVASLPGFDRSARAAYLKREGYADFVIDDEISAQESIKPCSDLRKRIEGIIGTPSRGNGLLPLHGRSPRGSDRETC